MRAYSVQCQQVQELWRLPQCFFGQVPHFGFSRPQAHVARQVKVSQCVPGIRSLQAKSRAPGFSAAWTIAQVMTSAEHPGSPSTASRENSCTNVVRSYQTLA
ncbi:hypothetical protein I79_007807 [Cricetulus griseus]|uniref:Uncharacterized protein n=1 Tax=Cricetulus griseus TaxID=10029 RepID=G3HBH9_CRIGR|nr:hypothetical protein I79_007807 [Cricetulus griseus]